MSRFPIQPKSLAEVEAKPKRIIDVDVLRSLASKGLTQTEIARHLSIPKSTIKDALKRHNIVVYCHIYAQKERSPFWRDNDDTLISLFETGIAMSNIAREIGTTKNAVVGRLKTLDRIGERRPKPKMSNTRQSDPFPASGHCLYARGRAPNYNWCGERVAPGSSYCPEHHKVCYRGIPDEERFSDAAD